jgi:pSer/pThr/pTyr-binding forkhead associated (FHA) protein
MKQFWTPLARVFGMVDAGVAAKDLHQSTVHPPSWVIDATQWPDLYKALRTFAQEVWCQRSQRHAEVNPSETLSVREVRLQACSEQMDKQLQDWFGETQMPHLIQWMIRGPFNTDEIRSNVNFQDFDHMMVLPFLKVDKKTAVSPYLVQTDGVMSDENFLIEDVCEWVSIEQLLSPPAESSLIDVVIEDGFGERHLQVRYAKLILGAEKTVLFPNGDEVELKDQSALNWHGETVWFLNINARHVSGMHLWVNLTPAGFEVQDLYSTNGSYVEDQRLPTHSVLLHGDKVVLTLGGPLGDLAENSARVKLKIASQSLYPSHNFKTPLRVLPPSNTALFKLVALNGNDPQSITIERFPFLIGRDLDCQWKVPAQNAMVSRRHLMVLSADVHLQRIQIQDISRYGLTFLGNEKIGPAPVWLSVGETLTLGKTDEYQGFVFSLRLATQTHL